MQNFLKVAKIKMPVVLLERMSFLNLRLYSAVSVLLLACAAYYTHLTVVSFNDDKHRPNDESDVDLENTNITADMEKPSISDETVIEDSNSSLSFTEYYREFSTVLLQEQWCVLVRVKLWSPIVFA